MRRSLHGERRRRTNLQGGGEAQTTTVRLANWTGQMKELQGRGGDW